MKSRRRKKVAHREPGFRLGEWWVQPALNRISLDQRRVHLEPKVMDLLVYLAERPGRVVEKDELLRAVWPDTFVSEVVLPRCISQLRGALQDDAHNPRYIETIPKRGYRLVAEVGPTEKATSAASKTGSVRHRRSVLVWSAVVTAATLVAAILGWRLLPEETDPSTQTIESLAVLPLRSRSVEPDPDYFAEALTDLLITDLAKIGSLRVISETTASYYTSSAKELPEIARELQVDAVVEGTVVRTQDRVRITARLIDARSDRHLWAESYERELRDVLRLQREIARSIADGVRVTLTPEEVTGLSGGRRVDGQAFEIYSRARALWKTRREEALEEALGLFHRCAELDPTNPLVHSGLSDTYVVMVMSGLRPGPEALPKAKLAAQQALDLDPTIAEAHVSLGMVRRLYDWDWPAAEEHFRRAIDLKPSYATGRLWYASFLATLGRFDEAIFEIERAKQLDPLSAHVHLHSGWIHHIANHPDRALEEYRRTLDLGSELDTAANGGIGAVLLERGEVAEAVAYFERSYDERIARIMPTLRDHGSAAAAQHLKRLLQEETDPAANDTWAYWNGYYYALVGDFDSALEWLEKAYRLHDPWLTTLAVEHPFLPLHSDPRFRDLAARVGLSLSP